MLRRRAVAWRQSPGMVRLRQPVLDPVLGAEACVENRCEPRPPDKNIAGNGCVMKAIQAMRSGRFCVRIFLPPTDWDGLASGRYARSWMRSSTYCAAGFRGDAAERLPAVAHSLSLVLGLARCAPARDDQSSSGHGGPRKGRSGRQPHRGRDRRSERQDHGIRRPERL